MKILQQNQCSRCLYTIDHPLGLVIDESGICSGCRVHEEKNWIDWKFQKDKLLKLIGPYRSKKGNWDCIVPVSGNGESHYLLHLVKNELDLRPLAVCNNRFFNTDIGIKNLANIRNKFDVDILFQNINPVKVKKVTRSTFRTHGSIYWPVIAGQTSFPVQISVKYQIPLILWGSHEGVEQVGMFSHLDEAEMTELYRRQHHLLGSDAETLLSPYDTLTEADIKPYVYPNLDEIRSGGTRGMYLSNFFKWDPLAHHAFCADRYGLAGTRLARTFDVYDHADCFIYMGIHDLIKKRKVGYGKVLDHACREIRHGRISRDTGQKLVRFYEKGQPLRPDLFFKWLGIDERSFFYVLSQFERSKEHRFSTTNDILDEKNSEKTMIASEDSLEVMSRNCDTYVGDEYITYGKGVA